MAKSRALKKAIKNTEKYMTITDRNGCKLRVPRDGNSEEAKYLMEYALLHIELSGVDNTPLGAQMDVVSAVELDDIGMVRLHLTAPNSTDQKMLILPKQTLLHLKKILIQKNFLSYEAFVANILPAYNGPDKASFVGLTDSDGITYGFMISLPLKVR